MDDDQILKRGGTEEDIRKYAEANGANLTAEDYAGPGEEDDPWAEDWEERMDAIDDLATSLLANPPNQICYDEMDAYISNR